VKKAIFDITVDQDWTLYGPHATCGPLVNSDHAARVRLFGNYKINIFSLLSHSHNIHSYQSYQVVKTMLFTIFYNEVQLTLSRIKYIFLARRFKIILFLMWPHGNKV